MMPRRGVSLVSMALGVGLPLIGLLSACDGGAENAAQQPVGKAASSVNRNIASSIPPAAQALELAAAQAGLITNGGVISPVGLYRHRHEAGRDSLCLLPGKEDGVLRFGMEASFGENIDCQGHGTARLSGDRLIFNFARSACIIIAQYEGDRIVLPGALDGECQKHCTNRGSLAGVSFPRVSREASVAAAATTEKAEGAAKSGGALCPAV